MVSLRNSLVDGRDLCTVIGVSDQPLFITRSSHYYKNFIILKDLEQYRSTWVAIDYKVYIGNEYLLSSLYYQAMSTTAIPHATIESDLNKRRSNNHRYFVLCNSCFWCASYLLHIGILRCPSCKNEIMEFMPIRSDETFLFQYDRKRGVSLQFLTA
jgi:hypothetical protein